MKTIIRNTLSIMLVLSIMSGMSVTASEIVIAEFDHKQVSIELAKKVGQYHLDTFYATEQKSKEFDYVVNSSFLQVYDISNNPFAYLIGVNNSITNEEVGYVMIGSSYANPAILEASVYEPIINKLATSKNAEQLTYVAPLVMAMKEDNTYRELRTGVEIDPSQNTKTDIITTSQKNSISSFNAKTWSALENMLTSETLESVRSIAATKAYVPPTEKEVYDESNFCKIKDGSIYRYGGRQQWWNGSSTYDPDTSCGVVAAANITAYWAKHKSSYSDLYDYSDLYSSYHSKSNFLTHMEDVYSDIDPTIIGVYSTSLFRNRTRDYMDRKLGYYLSSGTVSSGTYSSFVSDIKDALDYKAPIAMLYYSYDLSGSAPIPNFAMHWVTYTKYFKDNNTQNEYFACSSWGTRYSLGLYDYYNCYDINGGVYFK